MIIAILIIVGIVVIGAATAIGLRNLFFAEGRQADEIRSHESTDLVYAVPAGQDPAVLITALHHSGFAATSDFRDGRSRILVDCPAGRDHDREPVRAILHGVHVTSLESPGPSARDGVRFEDEA